MTAKAAQTDAHTEKSNGHNRAKMPANGGSTVDLAIGSEPPATFIAISAGSIASCWAYLFNPSRSRAEDRR